jgi:hypothetical protein
VLTIQAFLSLALSAVLFAVKVFALGDCVVRDKNAFVHTETLAKAGWIVILVLAVLLHLWSWSPLGLFNLIGTVAALVYLAQLRGSAH